MGAVVALLGLLLLPVFGDSERNSRAAVCSINIKRLIEGWSAFPADHADALPFNANAPIGQYDWCGSSFMDLTQSNPNNWNHALYTKRGQLWPYVLDTSAFSCPDDPTRARASSGPDIGRYVPRIRSYSMNSWIGDGASGWLFNSPGVIQVIANRSQVRQPDQTFVFIEEHPDSINDGMLYVDMVSTGPATRIIDYPAAYHYLGANLSFADGSVRYRQWVDPRTTPPPHYNNSLSLNVSSPRNLDVAWLQSVTTYLH